MSTMNTTTSNAKIPSKLLHSKLPSRPLQAFNIFFQEQKKRVLQEHVGSPSHQPTYADIVKHLKAKWRTIDSEERRSYNERASVEKVRFAHELLAWNRRQDAYNRKLKRLARQMEASTCEVRSP